MKAAAGFVLIDARLARASAAAARPAVLAAAAAEGDAEAVRVVALVVGEVGGGVRGRGRGRGESDEGVVPPEGGRHLAVVGRHRGELRVQVLQRKGFTS